MTARRVIAGAFACLAALALVAPLFGTRAWADDAQEPASAGSDAGTVLRAGVQSDSTGRAKRTVMFYVCGSNLEENAGVASENIKQVLRANFGDGEDVRFIVMTGGSSKWYLDDDADENNDNGLLVFPEDVDLPTDAVRAYDPEGEDEEEPALLNPKSQISGPYNQIWEARSAGAESNPGKLVLLDGNGLGDDKAADTKEWMSDPETLRGFINYAAANYPADKYDLILWDHGGGTTGGFALDFRRPQSFFGSNTMRFHEILSALKDNKVVDANGDGTQDGTFDFVNFDACLMGSTEIALALADYTDYYIASPDEIPGDGESYTGWLDKLGQNPNTGTRELGTTLVDDYIAYYNAGYDDGTHDDAAMALIDTKALLRSGFVGALNTISQTMTDQAENALFYDELRSVKGSIKYKNCSFYDLGNLVSLLGTALWEIDADSVSDTYLSTANAYTEAARTVLGVLNDPEIIYARNTSSMKKAARFFTDAEGNTTSGTFEPSGLQLYFPLNIYKKDVIDYDEEVTAAIELMPRDGRAEFLQSYVKAMYDYNLIQLTGSSVSTMVASGYESTSIGYDKLKEFWMLPDYPDIPEALDLCEWSKTVEELFAAMGNGDAQKGENDARNWLDKVVRQQAAEAVSAENVTAQSVLMNGGTGSKVAISNTRRRAVESVCTSVTAELPAVQNYIQAHSEQLGYLRGDNTQIKLDTVNGTPDFDMESIGESTGDFIRDNVNWFNTATTANWSLQAPTGKAYAISDANGKLHAALTEIEPGLCIVPFILEKGADKDPDELEMLLFGFEDGKVSSVYLTDDAGNRRVIKASDLKTELRLMPALAIDEFSRNRLLPISTTSLTVTPQNIGDIELVYADVRDISDIGDADGDGNAFNYKYEVTDIYGSQIDITQKVENPEGSFISIALAEVQPMEYTGEELTPQVTYNGKTLVEGEDYDWMRNEGDDPIVLPGSYGITVIGMGDYTDLMITTFEVIPTPEDVIAAQKAEEAITAALAKVASGALDAGDADALAAVDTALAAYNGLTEAQKTQVSRQTVMALLVASQKASDAKAATAQKEADAKVTDAQKDADAKVADAQKDAADKAAAAQKEADAKVAAAQKEANAKAAAAKRIDLSKAEVSVAKATYKGKPLKPKVTVTFDGKKLKAKTDYTVTYANNKAAGTGVAVVKGVGSYAGAAVKTFKINKAKNTLTVKTKTAKVKKSKVKAANVKLAVKKAIVMSKAKGKVTYKKASGSKKITIAKNGRITVKKGIGKGTYKVKAKVTAAGTANYKKLTRTVTFKVKVA